MKKINLLLVLLFVLSMQRISAQLLSTPESQMEVLDRGLVVIPTASGNYLSWRLLGTDSETMKFDIFYNNTKLKSVAPHEATSYLHSNNKGAGEYKVVAYRDGVAVDSAVATKWAKEYLTLTLDRPTGSGCTYSPNDCSVGDVDGDGAYEIIVKWDPSNSQDNSIEGTTGNVYLDCYKVDITSSAAGAATKLWRIDLGRNIRAGAHYTQFLVWDFDGDGKAEMICKTAPGSKDGEGNYVTAAADDSNITSADNSKSYADSNGRINSGPEYLTVFNGLTGKAIHTVFYNPNRAGGLGGAPSHPSKDFWGDNYGGRCDRYLATVAYLDSPDQNPSAIMCRGYYTKAYLWAVDFDGSKLSTRWLHFSSDSKNWKVTYADGSTKKGTDGKSAYDQGNHNLSCGDVDGDGKDEVVWGSCAFDDDGTLLYSTAFAHGDAMHFGDLDPDHPGLEVFTVHEENYRGMDIHDAATGTFIKWVKGQDKDTGRGMCANIDSKYRGYEFWGAKDESDGNSYVYSIQGGLSSYTKISPNRPSQCFRLYWDGDVFDELYDGSYDSKTTFKAYPVITKWDTSNKKANTLKAFSSYGSQSCNTTKATPCLSADIFGDWREEVLMWNYDNPAELQIFSTTETTKYRIPTLMHDHVYRLGVAWQNVAYNQPPHLGYYLEDYAKCRLEMIDGVSEQTILLGDSITPITYRWANCAKASFYKGTKNGTTSIPTIASGGLNMKATTTTAESTVTFTGKPTQLGEYMVVIRTITPYLTGDVAYDTLYIHVVDEIIVPGDANDDGFIDVADITAIAAYILAPEALSEEQNFNKENADANKDGFIDVADITKIAALILGE